MKYVFLIVLMASNLFAQSTVCDKGMVDLIMKENQNENCYKKLKLEKSYKYRICDSGVGFLYNDKDTYPERLYFDNKKWNWRVDTIDYSNNISSTYKMELDKDLTLFTYSFVEKTFKGQDLQSYKCDGEFHKH